MHWRRGSRQVSTSLLQAARGVGVPSSTSCTAALGFSFRAARGVGGPCSTSSTAAFGFSFCALLGPTVEQLRGRISSSCALFLGGRVRIMLDGLPGRWRWGHSPDLHLAKTDCRRRRAQVVLHDDVNLRHYAEMITHMQPTHEQVEH